MRALQATFLALAAAAGLAACAVTGPYYDRSEPFQPDYVYLYPDGCWADGQWYAPCLWSPGPNWGYYRYDGGYYHWQQHYYWQYRPGYPPPGYWRHRSDRFPHVPRYPAPPRQHPHGPRHR
jgi:hypothetical protein